MILIAESGSTKTNWVTEKNELYETIGFNPLFDTTETIYNELSKHEGLLAARGNFTKVFFYGASCSSQERNTIVYNALKKYFTNAEVIHIDHDLKAAAIATYDGRPGIACILGTGSNSCLYDGTDIHEVVPSLGYVLGDEGSGAYFGKKLVAAYLYHELPEATNYIMKEVYKLEKEEVLKHVYNKPNANVYLARFAKVMNETTDKAYMDKLAEEGFTDFFNHHVKCYKNYQQYPVHFVGSIAFHFKHVLQEVANKMGCELGIVDRNPVYRLVAWHLKSNK
jgi:N-acetylglucosamine kinase-like BadF-type ATPase